jgi:predicted DNA-binding transcriptional regulator AlpA
MKKEDLMTLEEVAEFFQCSTRHLQEIRKMDRFPKAIVLGKTLVRYLRSEIEKFLLNGGLKGGEA